MGRYSNEKNSSCPLSWTLSLRLRQDLSNFDQLVGYHDKGKLFGNMDAYVHGLVILPLILCLVVDSLLNNKGIFEGMFIDALLD